ncbi:citrate lyase holo-[acyl-carrier protein] synthase [Dysosmobacter sp. HCP28S3_G4]|uniref:citrate lyase holo-[acyl-carrier protein] synthase n=1 Tax=Dysosmobacter sp. HCP28S3_G4 TaxID=3438938 RepID=UPI003F8CC4E6
MFSLAPAGFQKRLRQLCLSLQPYPTKSGARYRGITSEEALLADADPWAEKRLATAPEEHRPQGRLWDMDVLTILSRQMLGLPRRAWLLCEEDAKVCGHGRRLVQWVLDKGLSCAEMSPGTVLSQMNEKSLSASSRSNCHLCLSAR